jgi:hypothetical protein
MAGRTRVCCADYRWDAGACAIVRRAAVGPLWGKLYRAAQATMRQYFVYIMTNRSHTLYIGVTNDPFVARRLLRAGS